MARTMTAIRIPPDDLLEIDRRARQHKLTRTEYMIRAATGELAPVSETTSRLDKVEDRLDRIERLAFEQ